MTPTRRTTLGLLIAAMPAAALGQPAEPPVRLFRVVTARGDITIGVTPRDLAALGPGPEVERLARRIAQDGQLTAWRYEVTRAPDGSTRFATRNRVAILRQDSLIIEPYAPALPVLAPPAE
jgi:hypothetical protein